MARNFGFRIFVVELYENRKKDKEPVDISWGTPAANRFLELLATAHADGTFLFPEPKPPADGSPAKSRASITVGPVYLVRDGLVHLSVAAGEVGSHRQATKPGEPPMALHEHSPEADHYVTVVFPMAPCTRLLVVSQTIRQRDVTQRLFSLLLKIGMREKKEAVAAQETERATAKERGDNPKKLVPVHRFVFDRRQATDENYLQDIIMAAEKAAAIFTGYRDSARGEGERVARVLRVNLIEDEDRDASVKVGRGWIRRRKGGEETTQAESVEELGQNLSDDVVADDELGPYQKASLSIVDRDGETTSIAVDTLRDVFTYPVSDGAPPVVYYYGKVSPRLDKVAAQEVVEISTIDPVEVSECLDAST